MSNRAKQELLQKEVDTRMAYVDGTVTVVGLTAILILTGYSSIFAAVEGLTLIGYAGARTYHLLTGKPIENMFKN